jgi:hypothetical protein
MDTPVQTSPTPETQIPEAPQIPRVERDDHWISILAMAIFILFSLGVVIFLYYQNQQLKNMLANYQVQPIASPTPTATSDQTANLKTYTDSKGVFEFKYPETSDVKVFNSGSISVDDKVTIVIKNKSNLSVGNTSQPITINGIDGITYIEAGAPFATHTTEFQKSGIYYIFSYGDPNSKTLFDQILSTFKFISPSPSPVPTKTPVSSPSAVPNVVY